MVGQDNARIASRLSAAYILRSIHMMSSFMGGDFLLSVVFEAVVMANVGYLDQTHPDGAHYRSTGDPVPDELRRPVSVLAVSQSLGLSYETTRRYVKKLMAAGYCVKVNGGLIVPARATQGETQYKLMQANFANLRRLFKALKAVGVDLD